MAPEPLSAWAPEDAQAHIEFQIRLNEDLTERGELVGAGPDGAGRGQDRDPRRVGAPVVSDGPFPEAKEFLAGYRIVDVESPGRALEIAAQASAAPGPGGVPIKTPIEVREIMGAPQSD